VHDEVDQGGVRQLRQSPIAELGTISVGDVLVDLLEPGGVELVGKAVLFQVGSVLGDALDLILGIAYCRVRSSVLIGCGVVADLAPDIGRGAPVVVRAGSVVGLLAAGVGLLPGLWPTGATSGGGWLDRGLGVRDDGGRPGVTVR
jgi:hypothetical protein